MVLISEKVSPSAYSYVCWVPSFALLPTPEESKLWVARWHCLLKGNACFAAIVKSQYIQKATINYNLQTLKAQTKVNAHLSLLWLNSFSQKHLRALLYGQRATVSHKTLTSLNQCVLVTEGNTDCNNCPWP